MRSLTLPLVLVALPCALPWALPCALPFVFACEPPAPSAFPVVNCPDDDAFAPAFLPGSTVELQAAGAEDASYAWELEAAPAGADDALHESSGRRALIDLEVAGDYTICHEDAAQGGVNRSCCSVHAVDDLAVHELSRDELERAVDISSMGSTTSAADAEVNGLLVKWLQVNQDVDVEVALEVPEGVRAPHQVSPQRYVGRGNGVVELVAFYGTDFTADPDVPPAGRVLEEGDEVVWHVALTPLVAGSTQLLDIPVLLAARTPDPRAARINDARLVLDEEGWRVDLLDVDNFVADSTFMEAGGWDVTINFATLDGDRVRLRDVELRPGQRIAVMPWSYVTRWEAGPAFALVVPDVP